MMVESERLTRVGVSVASASMRSGDRESGPGYHIDQVVEKNKTEDMSVPVLRPNLPSETVGSILSCHRVRVSV